MESRNVVQLRKPLEFAALGQGLERSFRAGLCNSEASSRLVWNEKVFDKVESGSVTAPAVLKLNGFGKLDIESVFEQILGQMARELLHDKIIEHEAECHIVGESFWVRSCPSEEEGSLGFEVKVLFSVYTKKLSREENPVLVISKSSKHNRRSLDVGRRVYREPMSNVLGMRFQKVEIECSLDEEETHWLQSQVFPCME